MQKRTTPAPTMPVNPTLSYYCVAGSLAGMALDGLGCRDD